MSWLSAKVICNLVVSLLHAEQVHLALVWTLQRGQSRTPWKAMALAGLDPSELL